MPGLPELPPPSAPARAAGATRDAGVKRRVGTADPPCVQSYTPSNQVLTLLAHGRKIEAIKQLREETGLGLKEAKEAVEAIPRAALPAVPVPIGQSTSRGSAWRAAVVVAALAALAWAYWSTGT